MRVENMTHWRKLIVVFSLLSTLLLVGGKLSAEDVDHAGCPPKPLRGGMDPQVCIMDGCLRGKTVTSLHWGTFEAFVGIPFAKPPIGELRFANPVPNEWWGRRAVYNATEEKPMCVQKNDLIPNAEVQGSEDCLYLNVYRPSAQNTLRGDLPVMVYIHGGGFFAGSASSAVHGPEYFMETGRVILVTLQYRLGVFGFFSIGEEAAPGNFALKDQVMALHWVKKNIAAFGGDPRRVTIFGQSAGAASVQMHMISPMSVGLFSKAIMMSGSANAPWNIPTKDPLKLARRQAEVFWPCASKLSPKQLVSVLRSVDAQELAQSIDKLKAWSIDPLTLYRPVVEPPSWSNQAFLVEDPRVSWQKGNYQQVPWMTGYLPNEGAVRAIAITSNENQLKELNANISHLLPVLLEKQPSAELLQRIKERFFSDGTEGEWITKHNAQRFVDMFTEAAFLYPIQATVKQHITTGDTQIAPVSIYKFSFKGPHSYSFYYTFTPQDFGVVHCDELIYLFRSPALFEDFPPASKEAAMSRELVQFFIDFAYNGVATPLRPYRVCSNDNELYQSMDCDVLEFTNSEEPFEDKPFGVRIVNGRNEDLFAFWNNFY
ncbi:juvenile hormone esterase-like [Toxorhynchites rutilus septentrionalis]|uniref:juvenile hormone esterase-like n=1 Tax=Toxorhynchites rutilus septentrionalis TaxID=329112 RepID=UPI002479554D|nr:juvenile hormone esterase-like [Toxorhynchites rutilus septentrionalis]XP_055621103.1 juvenile hormone esterase-like [Toxorhynchites rutilus septentrionalis]XP_055621104.1 juvenile hormone esterase-like [Toxorhynchites rutilus septentrionalis]XP_055621105.1 juvenile hormone esterase-like [Toxorhynchites rutilus septentrionalis]XP_055621106.1 juvenile hormone esterase-like [Toxorhynchites rutilus septentrionalis]XP_055621107.1 juvenile hormone esterase-like [Toxorhynchites rutilus septentrio